jgi:predicted dehydrogenase
MGRVMSMKKLCVIGCGGIGEYHLRHFVDYGDVDLAGFCDLLPERAEKFAKVAGRGKAFTDYVRMYDEISPDMVFILVPPYKHGEIEYETIKRGIHMFIEKPMALDMGLAADINRKIMENNLISAVGLQCRYDNINIAAKEFIENNKIVIAQGSRIGGVPSVHWWRVKSLSGGQLVEQTIHQVDIMRYLLGEEVDTVYSVARRGVVGGDEWQGYDSDDVSTTMFTFKSGLTWTLITGCYSLNNISWESSLTLGARSSRLDYRLCADTTIYGVDGCGAPEQVTRVIKSDGTFGDQCDRTFVDAVISGDASKIRSPYSDALKTLALTLACNESMETGLPVKVIYS